MTATVQGVYFRISELPIGALIGIVGLDTERSIRPLAADLEIASEITDFGMQYKELHKGSITAGESAALFNAYLLGELGKFEPDEEQGRLLDYLFNQKGKGYACNNAVDYDKGDKSIRKPNETYRSVLWITQLDDFVLENGIWRARGGDRKPKAIPASGYAGRTCDGAYDPDGAPFETWPTREEAEKTWTDVGFAQEFAGKAVSYFWSRHENSGVSAVDRRYWDDDYGRFNLDADWRDPDDGLPDVGRLPASRSPGRARQGSG